MKDNNNKKIQSMNEKDNAFSEAIFEEKIIVKKTEASL